MVLVGGLFRPVKTTRYGHARRMTLVTLQYCRPGWGGGGVTECNLCRKKKPFLHALPFIAVFSWREINIIVLKVIDSLFIALYVLQ